MLARNSDLCRFAASICLLFSSISRNSRAFWIAKTDCVAKAAGVLRLQLKNFPPCDDR